MPDNPIYIGTILPEKRRWVPPRIPTYRVSEWIGRFQAAGFDGMELWQFHATNCPREELDALVEAAASFPVAIFSAYVGFEDEAAAERESLAEIIHRFRPGGVKYNLGADPARRSEYIANLQRWKEMLPAGTRLMSECHAGTIMETPEAAASILEELADPVCQAIVHPFTQTPASLERWFELLGVRIVHAHVQVRDEEDRCTCLACAAERVRAAMHVMRRNGYGGSFTLEFTHGVGAPDEDADILFGACQRDREFLLQVLAAAPTSPARCRSDSRSPSIGHGC